MAEYLDKAAVLAILDEYDKVVEENDKPTDGIFERAMTKYARNLSATMKKVINAIPTVTPTINVVQTSPWIKIEDAVPQEDECVIILTDDWLIWGARYHKGSFYLDDQCWTETVTHWMKPPAMPEEAAEKLRQKQCMESGVDIKTGEINEWWCRMPTARKDESNG